MKTKIIELINRLDNNKIQCNHCGKWMIKNKDKYMLGNFGKKVYCDKCWIVI